MAQIKNDVKDISRSASPEDKENISKFPNRHRSDPSHPWSTVKTKLKASPRKLLRRLSAADEVDRELSEVMSDMTVEDDRVPVIRVDSTPASNVAPLAPSYLPPQRTATGEDLNRFVSASTASGTTLTAGSAPSFVKHAGPVQIRHISPADVPTLHERVGKMIFDKVMMKWVKATAVDVFEKSSKEHASGTEGTSEDPFRDIESLKGDGSNGRTRRSEDDAEATVDEQGDTGEATENSEIDDEEEAELNSFSFDGPPAVVGMGDGMDDDQTTDSEDEIVREGHSVVVLEHPDDDLESEEESQLDVKHELGQSITELLPTIPRLAANVTTPSQRHRESRITTTPGVRSALKGGNATPVSVLKDPNRSRHKTPSNKSDYRRRRSVSFSDGKRDGPIRGLSRKNDDPNDGGVAQSEDTYLVPSIRSKRIADMMLDLEDSGKRNKRNDIY